MLINKKTASLIGLLCVVTCLSTKLHGQCAATNVTTNITSFPSSCTSNNGNITFTNTTTTSYTLDVLTESGSNLAGGTITAGGTVTVTNAPVGSLRVRWYIGGSSDLNACGTYTITLFNNALNNVTLTSTNSATCHANSGTIVIGGSSLVGADQVSVDYGTWVNLSSLTSNTITGLDVGKHVIRVRKNGTTCFRELFQDVGVNAGGPCFTDNIVCTGTAGANLWPNGTFGTTNTQYKYDGPSLGTETNYNYVTLNSGQPGDGNYSITTSTDHNGSAPGGSVFNALEITDDHTSDATGTYGYMMVVNASYGRDVVWTKTINSVCSDAKYIFTAWVYNLQPNLPGNPNTYKPLVPILGFEVNGVTQDIDTLSASGGWIQIGCTIQNGSSGTLVFSIRNYQNGGFGNDWAIDDIELRRCEPSSSIVITGSYNCITKNVTVTSSYTGNFVLPEYQWQVSTNGSVWGNISGATNLSLTYKLAQNRPYYFRLIGAELGSINSVACRVISAPFIAYRDNDCDGKSDGVDVDDDNDGITDAAEHATLPTGDADGDGIINMYDATPGLGAPTFVDNNADGISDVYDTDLDGIINQFDKDSDNDGVADLIESWGTDTDGNGEIDATTDIDGDGLIDTYDNFCSAGPSICGLFVSGTALINLDSDADGIANSIDLDSDNDGIPDLVEIFGSDNNNNGAVDIFTDDDKDGLADKFDPQACKDTVYPRRVSSGTVLTRTSISQTTTGTVTSPANALNLPDAVLCVMPNNGSTLSLKLQDTVPTGTQITLRVSKTGGAGAANTNIYTSLNGTAYTLLTTANTASTSLVNLTVTTSAPTNFIRFERSNTVVYNVDGINYSFAPLIWILKDSVICRAGTSLFKTGSDIDNNGTPNSYPSADNDADLVPNFLDLDSDQDGINDVIEVGGKDNNGNGRIDAFVDANGNGRNDAQEVTALISPTTDSNNDNLPDVVSGSKWQTDNRDGDGPANFLDLDSDNDGISDIVEIGAADDNGDGKSDVSTDTDRDGWVNIYDGDSDNNGTIENAQVISNFNVSSGPVLLTTTTGFTNADKEADGFINSYDLDSDGDGISDILEVGGADANKDGKVDGFTDANNNGWNDAQESTPFIVPGTDANNNGYADGNNRWAVGTDNIDFDLYANFIDVDSDDDGILDNLEAQTTAGFIGNATADTDADGLANVYDLDNSGSYLVPINTDTLDFPDYLDIDTDNDLSPDWRDGLNDDEDFYNGALNDILSRAIAFTGPGSYYNIATDANANGRSDFLDDQDADGIANYVDFGTAFYFDSDGDGLVDLLDANSGGKYTGKLGNIGVSDEPKSSTGSEKDWRNSKIATILPITILNFKCSAIAQKRMLSWTCYSDQSFTYGLFGSNSSSSLKLLQQYTHSADSSAAVNIKFNLADFNNFDLFELREIGNSNNTKLAITKCQVPKATSNNITLFPNPNSSGAIIISLHSDEVTNMELTLINPIGQIIDKHLLNISFGHNQIPIVTKQLSSGIYTFVLRKNDGETQQFKVVICN